MDSLPWLSNFLIITAPRLSFFSSSFIFFPIMIIARAKKRADWSPSYSWSLFSLPLMVTPSSRDQPGFSWSALRHKQKSTLSSNIFKSSLDVVFLWTEAATNRLMNKRKSYLVASQKWQQQQTVLVCCWLQACIVSNVVGGQWSNVEPAIEEKEELVVFAYQLHRLQQNKRGFRYTPLWWEKELRLEIDMLMDCEIIRRRLQSPSVSRRSLGREGNVGGEIDRWNKTTKLRCALKPFGFMTLSENGEIDI